MHDGTQQVHSNGIRCMHNEDSIVYNRGMMEGSSVRLMKGIDNNNIDRYSTKQSAVTTGKSVSEEVRSLIRRREQHSIQKTKE